MLRRFTRLCFLLLVVSGAARAEAQRPWHCLVGITGTYSSGFAGVLARHGIPYEIVLDHQLADPELLAKYDAILTATLSPQTYRFAAQPLETYVEAGGAFLFDAPYSARYFPRTAQTRGTFFSEFITYKRAVAPQAALVKMADSNLLAPEVSPTDRWGTSRITCDVTVDDPGAVVLAEYATPPKVMGRGRRSRVRGRMLDMGDPAMVLVPRGKGKFIVCGSSLGAAQALGVGHLENVVLALVRLLTEGRATPQLEPEGVALGRKQSKRSLDLAAPAETVSGPTPGEEEKPAPAGPGESASLPDGVEELADDPTNEFNVTATLAETGTGTLWLNYWNADNFVKLSFTGRTLDVVRVEGGHARRLTGITVSPGAHSLVAQERRHTLRLFVDHRRTVCPVKGLWRGRVGWKGTAFTEVRYQPVASVYFADDFMRPQGQEGEWELLSGQWKRTQVENPDMGANPFAFHVTTRSLGLATAGYRFWDTYRFRASVRPDSPSGALGLVAYRQDADDYYLFRAAIVDQPVRQPEGYQLIRVLAGQEEILASAPGGLVTGQTYALEIKVLDKWIGAFVDGQKVLTGIDASLPGGGIGLWADSAQVKFDDVVVNPADARQGRGIVFDSSLPSYAGVIDQDTWAGPAMQWRPSPTQRGLFWNRGVFYGDVGVRFDLRALTAAAAAAELLINTAPDTPTEGYRLRGVRQAGTLHVELSRNDAVVKTARVALPDEGTPQLAIRRAGDTLYGRVNGRVVVKFTDPHPLTNHHQIAFRFQGGTPRISDVAYWSDNVLDYTFDTAPVDWWIGSGVWDVTNRWSCTPDWSWFGGTSPQPSPGDYEGKAVIWCKHRFDGDIALDYFTGPKMLKTTRLGGGRERMQDFNAVLCGDGKEIDSGYAFMVGPGGADEVRLLRKGVLVARSDAFLMPHTGHNRWTYIRAQKQAGTLRLFFEGQLVLQYDDPAPLTGGYCGVWTENNGILVPKITIYHEHRGGPLLSELVSDGADLNL